MRNNLPTLMLSILLALPAAAFAQDQSTPVGTWTTIDDGTGQPKSVVEIYEAPDGTLAGKVIEVLQSDQGDNPICRECSGERKDQPIEGMEILWGLSRDGSTWEGGKILDPSKGKTYSVKLQTTEDGEQLEVRGFVGFSLLGRTQTWQRR